LLKGADLLKKEVDASLLERQLLAGPQQGLPRGVYLGRPYPQDLSGVVLRLLGGGLNRLQARLALFQQGRVTLAQGLIELVRLP
jgi:hypothetical protein